MNDIEAKNKLEEIIKNGGGDAEHSGDAEVIHIEADILFCELLRELGFNETVTLFESIVKWYA